MIWQLIDSRSVGGAERHIETLARSLTRHGRAVEIVLWADHGCNPWQVQLAKAGLTARAFDGRWLTLARGLAAERPQLLHTHGYKSGILGRLAARVTGVPVVSTFHSGRRGPLPVGAYEALDDWTSCLAHRIAVSAPIQARLPFSASLIPSYVETSAAPPTGPLPARIGFVGRLSPEKGPDIFCRLAVRAQSVFADAAGGVGAPTWHVWGDGPMRADLERRFGHAVTFHGVAAAMDQVWPEIGLLVMPSLFEGVPLAALEAAAHGVPVLASRVGGLPSVVVDGETGWLFPARDIDAALAGLRRWHKACTLGATEPLRAACRAKARADFSEDRWFPAVLAVYRRAGLR